MKPLEGYNFTLIELKDALRGRGLPTKGTKTELNQRLSEQDLDIWAILTEERRERMPVEEGASAVQEAMDRLSETSDNVLVQEDNHVQRELALIRKEEELLERKQQLLQREREISRSTSATGGLRPQAVFATLKK